MFYDENISVFLEHEYLSIRVFVAKSAHYQVQIWVVIFMATVYHIPSTINIAHLVDRTSLNGDPLARQVMKSPRDTRSSVSKN